MGPSVKFVSLNKSLIPKKNGGQFFFPKKRPYRGGPRGVWQKTILFPNLFFWTLPLVLQFPKWLQMLQIRPKNCLRVRKTAFIYDRDQTIIWYPCIMFLQCSLARRVGTTWWWANVISISIIFHFLIFTCTPSHIYGLASISISHYAEYKSLLWENI